MQAQEILLFVFDFYSFTIVSVNVFCCNPSHYTDTSVVCLSVCVFCLFIPVQHDNDKIKAAVNFSWVNKCPHLVEQTER